MRLGVDFGTTNSSIARYQDGRLTQVRLDPLGDNPWVQPSLLYVDRAYQALVGTPAALEYLRRETGRPVRWEKRHVGEIEVTAAAVHFVQDVHVMVDMGANGRLLQSIKTGLRDPGYEGTQIFDRFYTVDELIALVLRPLRQRAEEQLGEACDGVVIGRPVRFGASDAVSRRAEEILCKAALYAGFREVRFQMEPVGVVYLHHRATAKRSLALIFDFGGGTLDLAVAEVGGAAEPRVLATRGLLVGGDDLDSRIMQSLLVHFGAESRTHDDRPFPAQVLEYLNSWQTMPELTRPYFRGLLNDLKRSSNQPRAIAALETLVSRNLGFKLFAEIERAKKSLSTQPATRLDFEFGDIRIHELITRAKFEALIAPEIALVTRGVQQVLADAGLQPWQIDAVLRTGGTSAVPAFARSLAATFGEDRVRQMDLLTSVVGGLAVVAQEGGGWSAPTADIYAQPVQTLVGDIHAASGRPYEAYRMRVGAACYTDRPCATSRVPVALSGLPAIRTATADSMAADEGFLQFALARASRVYVALDARAAGAPGWLNDFALEEASLEIEDFGNAQEFALYSRAFPAGVVSLGGNQASGYRGDFSLNYLVAVRPLEDDAAGVQAPNGPSR